MKNQHHNWKKIFNQYKFVNLQAKSQQAYINSFYLASFRYILSFFQSQRNWSSQRYNNYWKNKTKSSDQLIIKLVELKFQSQLSAFKQSLMIIVEFTIFNQYCYNNWENSSFQVKDHYYHAVRNQAQTFQQSYSYKSAAYHDATDQLQEHYDSITAYHNTEKFSYNQAVD